ncbi:M23 family metallopeptidase [Bizionia saleffrena]|uniref:M23 family metallopeptidase n=1 Tax=Bizionia saleffrena TaxID=291189 RepID=A0A8H2QKG9_9FLAO|nr:M23 family metallopeptidase [Bizionia saleffrena]TYB80133.1 M23 family metallopeptidase [Bizionia saleffrena]
MKFYTLLILIFITTICSAEPAVKIYYEQIENGYIIYADNQELCPMSIKIDFTTKNLNIDGGNNNIYIIDPIKKRQLLTKLTVSKKGKAYKFSYKYWSNYGNHNSDNYNTDFAYSLPFPSSNTFKVYQGYNGDFSHQKENALDFTMPIGTKITAIREGVVINVVESNSKNCGKEECKKYNNFIIIYHPDGTFAEYTHLKRSGSIVKIGDKVKQGELIGYSGNVGWSTGPHLHLVVYLQKLMKRETIKTKFKTGNGEKLEYLTEKEEYFRNY